MYTHQITIELPDSIIHHYSIQEWETILLAEAVIQRDELPLSYSRIAEVLSMQLIKYRYFQGVTDNDWKCTEDTTYTNEHGNTVGTKMRHVQQLPGQLLMVDHHTDPAEPSTLQIGVANYRNDRKRHDAR